MLSRWTRSFVPILQHLAAFSVFICLGILFTNPDLTRFSSSVLGSTAGDNIVFVWNFWWAHTATLTDKVHLWTPMLFAPMGSSLLLHAVTPLLSLGSAVFFPKASPLLAYNSASLVSVVLNGLTTYAAAYYLTRDRLASLFAGITFSGAPFLIIRLEGHFNVLSAWGLPLVVLATLTFQKNPARHTSIALGVALACLAYIDYYAFVFGVVLIPVYLALAWWDVRCDPRPITPFRLRTFSGLIAVICVMWVAAFWIWRTGGAQVSVGGLRISMLETFNLRVAIGFLTFGVFAIWKWPRFAVTAGPDRQPRVLRLIPIVLGTAVVLLAPLVLLATDLWRAGDYVHQVYQWRSAPPGIDVASLVLGNAQHPLWGQAVSSAYDRFKISMVESSAWLGLIPLAACVFAMRRLRSKPEVRRWMWIGGLFAVWSLGPYLMVFGHNTGVMLPQTLIRFLPIFSNARMPGRAFVVVQLVVALLGAIVLASLRPFRYGTPIALASILLVVVDYWPNPRGMSAPNTPALYYALRQLPAGTVLEIPLGIRDGSGERGRMDPWALYYQTVHGHPLMGGFIARLAPRIRTTYESDPIVGPILQMSEGIANNANGGACRDSLACPIRYLVLNHVTASPDLAAFIHDTFSLRGIEHSDDRTLYSVDGLRSCLCTASPSAR